MDIKKFSSCIFVCVIYAASYLYTLCNVYMDIETAIAYKTMVFHSKQQKVCQKFRNELQNNQVCVCVCVFTHGIHI